MSAPPEVLSLLEAELVANYLTTICYGINLVTAAFCARTLLFTNGPDERLRKPHEIRWLMLIVYLILFAVCTFDNILGYYRNDVAFTKYDGPDGPAGYLGNLHDAGSISGSVVIIFGMLVADFVLVYRCFIVYARRWLVISLSIVLYLAAIAMGIRVTHIQITIGNGHVTFNSAEIKAWATSLYAITAVQNIITTGLLIWRIWRVEHQNNRFRASGTIGSDRSANSITLRQVIRIIAESGAIYTSFVIATFAAGTANSNALYPLSGMTLQLAGIMFNVIIIRSSPKREEQFTTFEANQHALSEQGRFGTLNFHGNSTKEGDTINGTNTLNTFSLQGAMKSSEKTEDLHHDKA